MLIKNQKGFQESFKSLQPTAAAATSWATYEIRTIQLQTQSVSGGCG
jgi:hypothetical protein